MIRRLAAFLLFAGCSHAPPSRPADPIACAYSIARSLPPSAERSMLLNNVAAYVTPCNGPAPAGTWAHDDHADRPARRAIRKAYEAVSAGDTAAARRAALDAWRESDLEAVPDPNSDIPATALDLLLDLRAYDELLDRIDAHPKRRMAWFDADGMRAEIAGLAATSGDDAAAGRAMRSGSTPEARDAARCEVRRGEAIVAARAGDWSGALARAHEARCRPTCSQGLVFELARFADASGHRALADSLVDSGIELARNGDRLRACVGMVPPPHALAIVHSLVYRGRVAQAEVLLSLPGWSEGFDAQGWTRVAIARWQRREETETALSLAFAGARGPHVELWSTSQALALVADTLVAAGWPDAARRALDEALVVAREEDRPAYRAFALAALARRTDADARIREALEGLVDVPNPVQQARALACVGAAARDARVTMDAEERAWLSSMARAPWRATLSE